MNALVVYGNEILKLEKLIKDQEDRKVKLFLLSDIIDKDIKAMQSRKELLELELKKEKDMVDAYMEYVVNIHPSTKFKGYY